jgi:hypothetical protein
MDVGYYRDLVRPLVQGRKFILAGVVLAGSRTAVAQLRSLGAERAFIIATGLGTGAPPDPEDADWAVIDIEAADIIEDIRLANAALAHLPTRVLEAIDAWDPDREAVMLGQPFYMSTQLAGRRVWGGRRRAWEALEDKVRVDALWDAAGVRREESMVVPSSADGLRQAHRRLDRGMGTAWAGDASEGFNGGAVYLRWVRTNEDAEDAFAFFSRHCDSVRVMPFLEGIPCSIHGMVFPGEVIAFRPCEMVVLRPESGTKLHYGGSATFWDPHDADREAMRSAAGLVGVTLREMVDYRGAFTIDGIMTAGGFLPTELNTRAGAAIGGLLTGLRDLPFGLIQRAVTESEPLDYRPRDLERLVVDSADEHRGGVAIAAVEKAQDSTESVGLVFEGEGYRRAADETTPDATLEFGPGTLGGFVRFVPDPERTPVGASLAPRAAAALRLADEIWDTGIGALTPARAVR